MLQDQGVEGLGRDAGIPSVLAERLRRRAREMRAASPGRSAKEVTGTLVVEMGLQDLDQKALQTVVADELAR